MVGGERPTRRKPNCLSGGLLSSELQSFPAGQEGSVSQLESVPATAHYTGTMDKELLSYFASFNILNDNYDNRTISLRCQYLSSLPCSICHIII